MRSMSPAAARGVLLAIAAALSIVAPIEGQAAREEPGSAADSEAGTGEKPAPTARKRRPLRIDDSNTGYIDNAIVGTQVRLRFDSAFDADRPDRAEFLYGKCICWNQVDGQRTADGPGVALDLDYYELNLTSEVAIRDRWSLFAELPLRGMDLFFLDFVIDPVFGAENNREIGLGLGDLALGAKRALLTAPPRYLSLRLTAYLPTGSSFHGRSTGHASLEPALLYLQQIDERWTLESELRLWIPLSGSPDPVTGKELDGLPDDEVPYRSFKTGVGTPDPIDNDDFAGEILRAGLGLSFDAAPDSRLRPTPVVELVAWNLLGGFVTVPDFPFFEDVSGDTIANLKVGLRLRSYRRGSWYLGYGFALTDEVWYDRIVRLEYRLDL